VREAHTRVDPRLEQVPGAAGAHRVACLLPPETRRALWAALRAGATPEEARARAGVVAAPVAAAEEEEPV
jgi:hypothetical protein